MAKDPVNTEPKPRFRLEPNYKRYGVTWLPCNLTAREMIYPASGILGHNGVLWSGQFADWPRGYNLREAHDA